MPSLPVLALAKSQTAVTCTSAPDCCQKCAKSASAGTGKNSNSSYIHISTRLLPKVCQVCQCWHWQNLKQQQHAHQYQVAAKCVPSLPVLALPNFLAMAYLSVLALIWCCQAQWVSIFCAIFEYSLLTLLSTITWNKTSSKLVLLTYKIPFPKGARDLKIHGFHQIKASNKYKLLLRKIFIVCVCKQWMNAHWYGICINRIRNDVIDNLLVQ